MVVVVYAATAQGTPSLTEEALEVRAFAPIDIPWQDLAFWSDESALRDHLGRASGPGSGKGRRAPQPAAALALVLVLAATLAGGYLALVSYHDDDQLSVGEIRMSVAPGHRGALDVYVPLVDWGARFEAIRAPVRLRVDLQTVDRDDRARAWPRASRSTSSRSATRRATRSRPT